MLYQTWLLPNGSLSDMGTIHGCLLIDDPCQTHIVFYNPGSNNRLPQMLTKNIAAKCSPRILLQCSPPILLSNAHQKYCCPCSPQILLPNAHQKYCCQMLTKNIATMLTTNIANTFIIKLKL